MLHILPWILLLVILALGGFLASQYLRRSYAQFLDMARRIDRAFDRINHMEDLLLLQSRDESLARMAPKLWVIPEPSCARDAESVTAEMVIEDDAGRCISSHGEEEDGVEDAIRELESALDE